MFHLSQHAGISSSPVQQSPEEGPCESAISEDICGLAKGRRSLIVGSSFGGTANLPEYASGAKLSLTLSCNIQVRKVTDAMAGFRMELLSESDWNKLDPEGRVLRNMNAPSDYEETKKWFETR